MKRTISLSRFLLISLLLSQIISCDKKNEDFKAPCKTIMKFNACGIEDIGNNIPWLNNIITISRSDMDANYLGTIWYKRYNNTDYIITNMMLGSGGLAYHTFNCAGDLTPIDDYGFYNTLSQGDVIWSNICPE